MEPTSQGRSSANIGSTVAKHRSFAPQLLSAHALSGCDTVASYFAIGKTKVVKVLEAGEPSGKPLSQPRGCPLWVNSIRCSMLWSEMWSSWNHDRCTLQSMGFQNWTKRCMPAAQTESYTTDSGGGQENIKRLAFRHAYGKLYHWLWRRSGKHKEAHFQACIWKAIPLTLEAVRKT